MSIGLTLIYVLIATLLDKHCNFLFGMFNQQNVPFMLSWVLGLVLGDWKTGLIVGAYIQTLNITPVVIGGISTMNLWTASIVTVPLVIVNGMDIETAMAIAAPMAILGNALMNIHEILVLDIISDNLVLKAVEKNDPKGVIAAALPIKWICSFIFLFAEYFVLVYIGTKATDALISAMPDWLINGFAKAGKLLPAAGFGIFLAVLGKKKYLPFFIMGAYMSLYMGLSSLKIGILAVCIGFIFLLLDKNGGDKLMGGQ